MTDKALFRRKCSLLTALSLFIKCLGCTRAEGMQPAAHLTRSFPQHRSAAPPWVKPTPQHVRLSPTWTWSLTAVCISLFNHLQWKEEILSHPYSSWGTIWINKLFYWCLLLLLSFMLMNLHSLMETRWKILSPDCHTEVMGGMALQVMCRHDRRLALLCPSLAFTALWLQAAVSERMRELGLLQSKQTWVNSHQESFIVPKTLSLNPPWFKVILSSADQSSTASTSQNIFFLNAAFSQPVFFLPLVKKKKGAGVLN